MTAKLGKCEVCGSSMVHEGTGSNAGWCWCMNRKCALGNHGFLVPHWNRLQRAIAKLKAKAKGGGGKVVAEGWARPDKLRGLICVFKRGDYCTKVCPVRKRCRRVVVREVGKEAD